MPIFRIFLLCLFVTSLLSVLRASKAVAFPESVVHGHMTCVSCHVSPTGGGVLNSSGRSLSKELMSDFGAQNEELLGHGLLSATPDWIVIGGNFQLIQTHLETRKIKESRFFSMQNEIEVVANNEGSFAGLTVSNKGGPDGTKDKGITKITRYQIGGIVNENFLIRAGVLPIPFGWMSANHTLVTEKNLGWSQGSGSEGVELWGLVKEFEITASYSWGDPELQKIDREKKLSVSVARALGEKAKAGLSLLSGKSTAYDRDLVGLYGIYPFTEKLFCLLEWDYQNQKLPRNTEKQGAFAMTQFGYQATKGSQIYLLHQYASPDHSDTLQQTDSIGIGNRWIPRPHFLIEGNFAKLRMRSRGEDYFDSAWILFNYYL